LEHPTSSIQQPGSNDLLNSYRQVVLRVDPLRGISKGKELERLVTGVLPKSIGAVQERGIHAASTVKMQIAQEFSHASPVRSLKRPKGRAPPGLGNMPPGGSNRSAEEFEPPDVGCYEIHGSGDRKCAVFSLV
jgi:hypothetical protein